MFYGTICSILLAQLIVVSVGLKNSEGCGEENIVLMQDSTDFNIPMELEEPLMGTCTYNVTGWAGTRLKLSVLFMHLDDKDNCTSNYVKVADNVSALESTKLSACGTGSIDITTIGHTMGIRINVTDVDNSFMIGAIEWIIDEENPNPLACGESYRELQSHPELFLVPVKDKVFEQPTVCNYLVKGSGDKSVGFRLDSLTLDGGADCIDGFLDVWVGFKKYSLCDARIPQTTFISHDGDLRLVLKTIRNTKKTKITGLFFQGPLNPENATTAITPFSLNAANRIFIHISLLLCIPLHWW